MEATQVPINRWVDKKAMVHIYNEILFFHKRKWNLTICDSIMGLEGIMLSEISQQKTNAIWFDLYVESKEQNKHNWNRLIDTENRLVVATGEGGWGTACKMWRDYELTMVVVK